MIIRQSDPVSLPRLEEPSHDEMIVGFAMFMMRTLRKMLRDRHRRCGPDHEIAELCANLAAHYARMASEMVKPVKLKRQNRTRIPPETMWHHYPFTSSSYEFDAVRAGIKDRQTAPAGPSMQSPGQTPYDVEWGP